MTKNNKYLEYTELSSEKNLTKKEQFRMIMQELLGGEGGYLVWRRQGGAGGSYPLGFFDTEEEAEEAKEAIEGVAEENGDSTGYYRIHEL